MALFKKPEGRQAYLKAGAYGGTGSGKTWTMTQVAIGLAKFVKERTGVMPPILFLDTENGSDWIRHLVEAEGIEFLEARTRAFADLETAVAEAERLQAIMLVDSITHFWEELKLSFAKKRKRKYNKLEFQDYGPIKEQWGRFTASYLRAQAHIILLGRAGNTYEYQDKEDEDTGKTKKELISTGTKMKAETEMGYEPSLLIEMVQVKDPSDKLKKRINREAHIIKDRADLLDGQVFLNPTFKEFLPHINFLNIGGAQSSFDPNRTSSHLFDAAGRTDGQQWRLNKDIVLEEIQELLVRHYPGRSAEDQRMKAYLMREHFGGVWKEIEEVFSLEKVRAGFDSLHMALEKKPSRYHAPEIDDQIPETFAGSTGASGPTLAEERAAAGLSTAAMSDAPAPKSSFATMDAEELVNRTMQFTKVIGTYDAADIEGQEKFCAQVNVTGLLAALEAAGLTEEKERVVACLPPAAV